MSDRNKNLQHAGGDLSWSRGPQLFLKRDERMLTDIADDNADPMVPDLSRLSDEELKLLGRLLLKAAGEFEGDAVPTFRVVREFVDTAEPTSDANHVG
jgi:hypothetical protein